MSVFGRLEIPELSFDEAFIYPEQLDPRKLQRSQQPHRQHILGLTEFAINLIAHVEATTGKCPLRSYEEDEAKKEMSIIYPLGRTLLSFFLCEPM
jgi:hypothetical protein